jgi:hypothetical protein
VTLVKDGSRENPPAGIASSCTDDGLPGSTEKGKKTATGRTHPGAIEPDRGIAQLPRGFLEDLPDIHERLGGGDLGVGLI